MNDELTNEIVLVASQGVLRRLRWYRFFVYLVAIGFGFGFTYVLVKEPDLSVGVVVLLVANAIGFFSAMALLNAVGTQIVTQKMAVALAKTGLMADIVKMMKEGAE